MEGYDVAQICLNGHVISAMAYGYPQFKKDFCNKCGEKTIMACQKCNLPIKGEYHVPGFVGSSKYNIPRFCEGCGKPYPWIDTKLQAAFELIDLMDSLNEDELKDFKISVEDLVRESTKVAVAKVKVKRYMTRVDNDVSKGLSDLLKDILSEKTRSAIE